MTNYPILTIIVVLLIIAITMIAIVKNKGEKVEQNYRAFFIIGITWIPLGITTDNASFWIMGFIFLIVGLVNRDKWKDTPRWSDLSPEKRKTKLLFIIGLITLLFVGLAFFVLVR